MSKYTIPPELLSSLSNKDSQKTKWTPFNVSNPEAYILDTYSSKHLIGLSVLSSLI